MMFNMKNSGFFEGDYVVDNDQLCFSVGDYIHVKLLEEPYCAPGEFAVIPSVGTRRIKTFPVRITWSAHPEPIDTLLKSASGLICKHWEECLEVGKTSVVTAYRMEKAGMYWYVPKIDGYIPGPNGKVKA